LKILIVKLSSLGDVVHAMPAVQDLRQAFAQAQIDWVVEPGFAALVRRCAGVNRVIECELRRWRRAPLAKPTRQAWSAFKADLQRERYDAVIDLQGLSKSALVAWLARLAPHGRRIGLANQTEGSSFEAPARWVAHVAVALAPHIHAVERARQVCARALNYRPSAHCAFGLSAQAAPASVVPGHRTLGGTAARGVVALVHGTSRADKQWPLAAWQALGQRLNASGYGVALPHGSDEELRVAQAIAGALTDATVWPRLGLDVLTDALGACAGVVGVDSGLSHMAVALDLPHVQIYNFDTAWRTGPLPTLPLDARQRSVFAQPTPSVDAVWQAWLAVSHDLKSA
jgi:heptosyltransferase-1